MLISKAEAIAVGTSWGEWMEPLKRKAKMRTGSLASIRCTEHVQRKD